MYSTRVKKYFFKDITINAEVCHMKHQRLMWHSSSDMAQVNTDMTLEPANIQDTVASGVFDPPTHHATRYHTSSKGAGSVVCQILAHLHPLNLYGIMRLEMTNSNLRTDLSANKFPNVLTPNFILTRVLQEEGTKV